MIELKGIRKVFNAGKPNEHIALDNITLTIRAQTITVFTGPSGSGKTTLLSIVGAMSRPTSGRIVLAGREITSLPERFLTEIRRKFFGFIFQHFNLLPGISVLENVMLPAYPTGEKFMVVQERARHLLNHFNLSHKSQVKARWLSGGETQRVAIARALMNNPAFIIADEPTAHLDTKLSRDFMELILRFKAEGKTILIASHDPVVHGADMVDTVVEMRDGRLKELGVT